MLKKYEIMIALRYLRSKRKEGFISVVTAFSFLGITLGVATLIIVMSVMNGYEVDLIERVLGINGHITISSPHDKLDDYKAIVRMVDKIPGVSFAAPMISEQGMAMAATKSSGVMIRAMNRTDILKKPLMASSIKIGNLEGYEEDAGVLIGITLARELRVGIGDNIKVMVPKVNPTILGSIPRMKTFKVLGIFDVGMYEYNAGTIFMPITIAQKLFQYGDAVSDIEVILSKGTDIDIVKAAIAENSDHSLNITDWALTNQNLITVLKVERNVMFLILTLIIIVAAFNIISSLIMLVKEKTKNIAILRTIGMTRCSVIKIFMLCGSMVGTVGTLSGGILGVAFSLNIERIRVFLESLLGMTLFDPVIYFLTQLPAVLEPVSVLQIMSMSLILSFLATIYPAWKASTLMPAEVLRYE